MYPRISSFLVVLGSVNAESEAAMRGKTWHFTCSCRDQSGIAIHGTLQPWRLGPTIQTVA